MLRNAKFTTNQQKSQIKHQINKYNFFVYGHYNSDVKMLSYADHIPNPMRKIRPALLVTKKDILNILLMKKSPLPSVNKQKCHL